MRAELSIYILGLVLGTCAAAATFLFIIGINDAYKPKQPELFDSMLCRVHTPTAAILVNDELITCTNGKKYRWVG
jgi:hypothetical protein